MGGLIFDLLCEGSLVETRRCKAPRANVGKIGQSDTLGPEGIVLDNGLRCDLARQQRQSYCICPHGN